MHRIFIGYDPREDIAYRVLKFSLEKHASEPVEIRPLILGELNLHRDFDPLASTEFTYSRFLVPYLCDFKGTALFMDCDMLCLSDIVEVLRLDLTDLWLRVVKHEYNPISKLKMDGRVQTQYPRKNWSSFMLLNCDRLTVWTKERVETEPAKWLHRFEPVPDEKIGEISKNWNVLDRYDSTTKLIHYTEGGPWFEAYKEHPYGDLWNRYHDEYLSSSKKTIL